MSKMKRFAQIKPVFSWDEVPLIFDIPMAARLLGKSTDWITRRCKSQSLPAFKDGREWRFEKERFQTYIQSKSVIQYPSNAAQNETAPQQQL